MSQEQARKEVLETALGVARENKDKLFSFATGVGKTYVGLSAIRESKSEKKWLVLVPQIPLINNFKEECIKHGFEDVLKDKIEDIICYNSIENYSGLPLNFLCDEAHHLSDLRLDIGSTIKSDEKIYLSATMPDDVKQRVRKAFGDFYDFHISMEEAIATGILPEPEVEVIYLTLKNRLKYQKYSDDIKRLTKEYEKKKEMWRFNRIMAVASERKRFIASEKTEAVRGFLKELEGKRYVVFSGSVEQAVELGAEQAVHSKNGKKKNRILIEEFNNLKSDKIYCCDMLREGMNLSSVDAGVVVQLAGNDKQNIQTFGRLYRSIAPKLYLFILKGTKDVDYFDNLLYNVVDEKYITIRA